MVHAPCLFHPFDRQQLAENGFAQCHDVTSLALTFETFVTFIWKAYVGWLLATISTFLPPQTFKSFSDQNFEGRQALAETLIAFAIGTFDYLGAIESCHLIG